MDWFFKNIELAFRILVGSSGIGIQGLDIVSFYLFVSLNNTKMDQKGGR